MDVADKVEFVFFLIFVIIGCIILFVALLYMCFNYICKNGDILKDTSNIGEQKNPEPIEQGNIEKLRYEQSQFEDNEVLN